MHSAFLSLLRKELLLAFRQKTDVVTVLFFFLIVSSLFPLAVGPELSTLKIIGPKNIISLFFNLLDKEV